MITVGLIIMDTGSDQVVQSDEFAVFPTKPGNVGTSSSVKIFKNEKVIIETAQLLCYPIQ